MGFYRQQAVNTRRGAHPDLDENDNPIWDVYTEPNVADREHNRAMSDADHKAHFMAQVAAAQALEPRYVQQMIAGTVYEGTHAEGLRQYQADLAKYRQWAAENEGKQTYVDDAMISRMSLEEYDQLFDKDSRPREGVLYYPNRSVRLDADIDPHSQRELGNR